MRSWRLRYLYSCCHIVVWDNSNTVNSSESVTNSSTIQRQDHTCICSSEEEDTHKRLVTKSGNRFGSWGYWVQRHFRAMFGRIWEVLEHNWGRSRGCQCCWVVGGMWSSNSSWISNLSCIVDRLTKPDTLPGPLGCVITLPLWLHQCLANELFH